MKLCVLLLLESFGMIHSCAFSFLGSGMKVMCFAFVVSSSRHELEDDIQQEQLLQKAHKVGQSWCARWREQRLT